MPSKSRHSRTGHLPTPPRGRQVVAAPRAAPSRVGGVPSTYATYAAHLRNIARLANLGKNAYKTYNAYKAPASTSTLMPAKKAYMSASTSATTAGFISRPRTKVPSKVLKNGIQFSYEGGGTLSDTNCAYIGHNTTPLKNSVVCVCRSLIKALYTMSGRPISTFNDTIISDGTSTLKFSYYPNLTSIAFTTVGLAITNTSTFESLSQLLSIQIINVINSNPNIVFHEIQVTPNEFNNLPSIISFQTCKLTITSKSSLKIQNRSLASADPTDLEADNRNDVSNVPLHGKSYDFLMSGTIVKKPRNLGCLPLVPDSLTGLFIYPGSNDPSGDLKEPPPGSVFQGCKKQGKVHIQPGTIKTSVLSYTKTFTWSTWIRTIAGELNSSQFYCYYGKFRLFALEKVLSLHSGEAPIFLAFEHDFKMGVTLQGYKRVVTMPIVSQQALPNYSDL